MEITSKEDVKRTHKGPNILYPLPVLHHSFTCQEQSGRIPFVSSSHFPVSLILPIVGSLFARQKRICQGLRVGKRTAACVYLSVVDQVAREHSMVHSTIGVFVIKGNFLEPINQKR